MVILMKDSTSLLDLDMSKLSALKDFGIVNLANESLIKYIKFERHRQRDEQDTLRSFK